MNLRRASFAVSTFNTVPESKHSGAAFLDGISTL